MANPGGWGCAMDGDPLSDKGGEPFPMGKAPPLSISGKEAGGFRASPDPWHETRIKSGKSV